MIKHLRWLYGSVLLVVLSLAGFLSLRAQSGISSALSGVLTDSTGAVVQGTVVATEMNTGAVRTVQTNAEGGFLFSQINPGTYRVAASAQGFASGLSQAVRVAVGQTVTLNFTLKPAVSTQSVEISARVGLMSLENPNTSTTLEAETIQNLPNPGQDLTYLAQFAQGALMNTAGSSNDFKAAGGYGNVEFNGLPATSNGYILDGYDTNDPFLGLNIGLSTNLVIGLDAVQEATVNTNSFSVDQGRYGASQVNYFTKSGTNQFHGDLYEIWNGSVLNAENYFLRATSDATKPRSNVHQFGASAGGPIRKNKLFFFAHYEGIRIALPLVEQTTVASPAYQNYVLQQLPLGGSDSINGTVLPPQPEEVGFYRNMFALYRDASGTPVPVLSCPLDANGALLSGTQSPGNLLNGAGCANRRTASLNNSDSENLIVVKIDHTIDANNSVWYRFQQDTGLQAASTDAINPIFNSYSPQPQRTLVVGYTHLFTPNLVNQFNPGASWYASIFEPNNFDQVLNTFPIVLESGSANAPFTTFGGLNNTFPQGRKVTQWQINDNLVWTRDKHTFKFGENSRRLDISNYDMGEGTVPLVTYTDLAQFTYGAAYTTTVSYPITNKERIALGNLDMYAMDAFKASPRVTVTAGLRATWNTNPVNQQRLFARPVASFLDIPHDESLPLNQSIQTQVKHLFPGTPLLVWQPRFSVAIKASEKTAVHAGFGVFNDIIPGQVADLGSMNAPYDPQFTGGLAGQVGGIGVAPGVTYSSVDATSNANRAFQQQFASGASSCNSASCPLAVGLNTFPSGKLKTPYFLEWNFGIEHELGSRGSLRVDYVGTRALHEPYQVQVNGYQTVCDGCFAPFPYQQPLDRRFGSVNEFQTGASSIYAGLQTAVTKQLRTLTLHGNYTYSHCLDEVSNGGLLAFSSLGVLSPLPGDLSRNYGNCDYDIRHNLSAFALYAIPFHSSHRALRSVFGDWQLSGTAFFHTGVPFSVLSGPYTANGNGIFQGSGPQFARRVPGVPLYAHKHTIADVTQPGTLQWLNPDAFASVVDPGTGACVGGDSPANCQVGDSRRNDFRGPRFTYSEIYVTKRIPLREHLTFQFDAQFFNWLNHPNFALPTNQAGIPGVPSTQTAFGAINSTVSPPTGLLGVGLGGDSAPRMIAFRGRIEF
ncbi:MAG TPA: carboxypeptidase-like regulatory domain-containing protein [Alloacidobacterium sp.]|nr:carboxypeptidase-like regulatory domain-containing protein [Alloacidobacterium sp.]